MIKIYVIVLLGVIVCGAYFYGANMAKAKCQMKYMQETKQTKEIFIQNKKEIHETVYKTGVRDIRRILCDKYSIAE